jgi:hypothetical protein
MFGNSLHLTQHFFIPTPQKKKKKKKKNYKKIKKKETKVAQPSSLVYGAQD